MFRLVLALPFFGAALVLGLLHLVAGLGALLNFVTLHWTEALSMVVYSAILGILASAAAWLGLQIAGDG